MITAYRREANQYILEVTPDSNDYGGDRKAVSALPRGSYDVTVTDSEIEAYREDVLKDSRCSPILAAIQRQESPLKVAAEIALHKLAAENLYVLKETDVQTPGVLLAETDLEAQIKFKQTLAAGQAKAFDAIREQQMGARWYERMKEVHGDKPTRVLPAREGPNGLRYD